MKNLKPVLKSILLTQNPQSDKVPPIRQEEVGKVRGTIREYRRGHFQVRFYYQGERFHINKYLDGTPLVHEFHAKRLREHINSLIDAHKFDPTAWRKDNPYIFDKALETWFDLSDCSQEWLRQRKWLAQRYFKPYFTGFDIRELNDIHIKQFLAGLRKLKFSDKYVYNIMGELKAFCNFHKKSIGKILEFPTISFQESVIRWLNEEQQDKIFEFIPGEDKPIFTFMKYTGCRPNEACGLLRENVFVDQGYFVLATVMGEYSGALKANTKTKRVKPLPIIPEIEEALKPKHLGKFIFMCNHWHRGLQPYSTDILERIWQKADKEAHKKYGIPIINLYNGLKHSLGCQRLNEGFSIYELKNLFSHTNIKTTERYAKYSLQSLANVMRGKVIQMPQGTSGEHDKSVSANPLKS